MITAQDIREKTFEKSTFGGYAMNEVDDFLDELANDLSVSQKELATMRAKMKVLVDKIEEYRGSEEDMHKALVSARRPPVSSLRTPRPRPTILFPRPRRRPMPSWPRPRSRRMP